MFPLLVGREYVLWHINNLSKPINKNYTEFIIFIKPSKEIILEVKFLTLLPPPQIDKEQFLYLLLI